MSDRHLNEAVRKLAWQTTEEFVVLTRREADALWEALQEGKSVEAIIDAIVMLGDRGREIGCSGPGLENAIRLALEKTNGKSTKNSNTNITEVAGSDANDPDIVGWRPSI